MLFFLFYLAKRRFSSDKEEKKKKQRRKCHTSFLMSRAPPRGYASHQNDYHYELNLWFLDMQAFDNEFQVFASIVLKWMGKYSRIRMNESIRKEWNAPKMKHQHMQELWTPIWSGKRMIFTKSKQSKFCGNSYLFSVVILLIHGEISESMIC